MKRLLLLIPLFSVVVLAGCSQQNVSSDTVVNSGIKANISAKLMAWSGDVKDQLLAIVAQHSWADNCFTMISGGVYNLTPLIASWDNQLLDFCGKDSTELFTTKSAIDPQKWEKVKQLQIMF